MPGTQVSPAFCCALVAVGGLHTGASDIVVVTGQPFDLAYVSVNPAGRLKPWMMGPEAWPGMRPPQRAVEFGSMGSASCAAD